MKALIRFFIYAVVVPGLPGCGTTAYDGDTWIDPALRPLVQDWADTCKKHTNPRRCNTEGIVSIKQVDKYDDANVLGQCEIAVKHFQETRYVTMLKEVALNTYSAKAILLHEMMHCRFKFERHEDVGVMGEHMEFSEFYYEDNWEKLLKETYGLVK